MTEEYWVNSQFSIARYYGRIQVNNKQYILVNKEGISLEELSNPKSKHYVGDCNKAIEPGEPADLVLLEWIPVYRALGRDKVIELIKKNTPLKVAQELMKKSKK